MRETLLEQRPADSNLKIAPYQESEDIQDFLEAFEGIMKLQKVKDADWVLRLTPLLRGKARAVCTDLGPTKQYAEVKEAILNHHSINPERCRRQFRELQWTRGKDPSEWVAKGNKLMRRWLKPADGIDKILEQIAVEQFLNGLPQEVRVWVASQNPTTSAEVAALLESYDSAHARPVKTGTCNPQQDQKHTPRSSNWKRSNGTKPTPPKEKKKSLADIVCFKCNKKGHVARDCPEKTYRVREETERRRLRGEGTVNGQGVKRIQIDTGASRTIVDKRFVRAEDLKKDKIRVTFGNQSSGEYPLANVRIIFDNEEYCVEAAVVENLAEDVLLGQDVPLHKHMVKRLSKEEQLELLRQLKKDNEDQAEESVEGEILMAKTRAMRKKEQRTTSSERTRSTTSEEQQRTTSSERERSTTSEEQQRTTSSERKRSTTSEEQQRTTSSERKRSTTSEEQQRTTSSERKRSTTSEEQQRTTSSEGKRSTTSEEQQRTTSSERKRSTTSEEQQRTTSPERKRSTTSEEQQRTTSSERERSTTSEEQQRTTSSEGKRSTTSEEQQRTTSSERKRSTTSEEQQRTTSSEGKRSTTSEEQQRTTSSEGKRSTTSEEQQRTTSSGRKRSTTSEEQQRTTSSEGERSTTSEEQRRTTSSERERSTTSEEQRRTTSPGRKENVTSEENQWIPGEEFPFMEELFSKAGETKPKRTRAERRRIKQRWKETGRMEAVLLKTEQEKDPEIQMWIQREDPERIKKIDGMVCRIWKPRDSPGTVYEQIVLPKKNRKQVIDLAHNIPFAGHLGREKTTQRVLRRFYWPTLFKDVREYCRTCERCQLTGGRNRKVPMIPLPIVGKPFQRIAMDVVGPLPRTQKGNRFILVLSDYATRYPEAIPLRSVTAAKVAEALIDVFARHGIPDEVLTDQGANFTSTLLGELYSLIGIKAIRTSPYHPQTDGLVERFNKTLKSMLRKVLEGEKRNWDKMLPYVLFAYREVPQATVGFSPFELLYGREVRGPLDVLKEEWIEKPDTETDVLSFVLQVRDRLETSRAIVEENARIAQKKQKEYYDQRARQVELKSGDKVLLMLPSSTKKFVAQWQGPYRITKRVGRVNYEIEIPDKGGRRQVFHVNHLKIFNERESETCNTVIEDGEDMEHYQWGEEQLLQFGEQLTETQREQIKELLSHFPSVTRNTPGITHKMIHRIRTTDCVPIRQKPYRIPQAYREEVLKELEEMEKQGIIEKSESEWASPLVIVTKKDGGVRLCVDYRKLNQETKFDAYPMPRIEELLDEIGKAKFITTLDLAKGYWQVPLAEEDREKTAFTTPNGLYQFLTMPFGLSGAPATFQRMMDEVLRGLNSFVGVYLDDIVIHSGTWEEHIAQLEEVFTRLKGANLTIKLKKCVFASDNCTYLGYKIGQGGVRPEEGKIKAVNEMSRPQTKKQIRTFLGMTGYYRRFVRDYATITAPLTELIKKNLPEKIEWSEAAEEAFCRLKKVLISAPLMMNPDFSRSFILQTDASGYGVGAVLSQGENGDQPIAYFSKKLLPRERAYSTIEKECLAIILAVKHFKAYLLGRPFMIQTDHRALRWLHQFREKNSRLTRWSLILQPYTFVVEHKKGRDNANADALSRLDDDTLHKVPEKEGGNVMDGHFVDEVACYSCGEVPDMTGEGGCNPSITQHSEALSRLTQQNTSKVMGLDGRRRREEDLTNRTLPEGASGRIQPLAMRNYKKDKLRVEKREREGTSP